MGPGGRAGKDRAIGTAALVKEDGADRPRREAPGFGASALLILKPGIAAGVSLSALAGLVLGTRGMPETGTALLCLSSVAAAATGSAILNGLLDAPIDARMERLSRRVAALGRVGKGRALGLGLALAAGGLFAAFRFLGPLAGGLVLAAVLSYVFLYTLVLKRRSPYGTIPGGIPGALPVLIGYAAGGGRPGPDGIILFLLMLLWQPPHFWALALEHQEDYRAAGVPVLPVVFGEPYTKTVIFIYAFALLPLSLALWVFGYCSGWYAAVAAAAWAYFMASCLRNTAFARRFGRAFGASIVYVNALLLAIVADVAARKL